MHLESLGVIILVTLIFYALTFVSLVSYTISEGMPLYLLGIITIFGLIVMFIEYGLEIIEESAQGIPHPPALSMQCIDKGRVGRQIVMCLLFGGLAARLFVANLDYIAVLILCFILLLFPASLVVNSLYENFLEIINPITLIGFTVIVGKIYVVAVIALATILAVFYAMYSAGLGSFLMFLPFGLYGLLVYFRFLGLVAHRHRESLLPEREFGERDRQIDQFYADNAKLHEVLEHAYWSIKEKRVDTAIELIAPVIKLADWARFETVFGYISEWSNKKPAIHFCKLYIPFLMAGQNAMRALSLCAWCLKHEAGFGIDDPELLEQLVAAGASKPQYIVLVKLLDNFVQQNPAHDSAPRYLSLAADICQDKLHHQQKFNELTQKLEILQRVDS